MSRGMTKAERLREMERLYLQRSYSDIEMAERLGVDRTTVFRDRSELETELPFLQDDKGRYRIDRSRYLSNIRLNLHEALALYLASRRASMQSTLAYVHTASALEKLALALHQPMTSRLVITADRILAQAGDPERVKIIETITRAWVEALPLRLEYLGLRGYRPLEYVVKPYLIEPSSWSDSIYLIGESDRHNGIGVFKVERIQRAVLMTGQFEYPQDFDENKLLRYAWGIWFDEGEPVTVRLRFAPGPAARRLHESRWHPTETVEDLPDGGCIWQAQVAAWEEMLPWVRGWGADVEVLEPEELREALKKEAKKLARLYGAGDIKPPQSSFYAHRREGESRENWQPLIEHLKNTAQLARTYGEYAGLGDLAYIAGLLHDLGKYSLEFQKRLEGGRRTDHSTAGARELKILLKGTQKDTLEKLLAYPIAGHHSGLMDYGDESEVEGSTLCVRLKRDIPDYSAYKSELDLSNLPFPKQFHIRPLRMRLFPDKPPKNYLGFSLSFMARLIFSALVDADFQETETYMQGKKPRGGHEDLTNLKDKLDAYLLRFENPQTEINRKRTETLKACINKAQDKPGFFKLTVPTGGGKTLASMAFALHHAAIYGLRRIIYVIPFTTIIEQNAAVFKKILGEENVLEHHSNFDWEQKERQGDDPDDLTNSIQKKLKLAAENWDIPIVVTTNVQFFESLFSNRASRCRKLHNLARSVIIFDEAQMLPREYMRPSMAAVWELVTNYGASAVFCTATQPGLERFLPEGTEVVELAPNPQELFEFYQRVEIKNLGILTDDELLERLNAHEQALCIVNTRRHASGLFGGLKGSDNYHLSTLMCPAHRKAKLAEIYARLEAGQSCRVVSTTVMEAGIDLDFPVGYRALSGLDAINQAAGRVNRNMRLTGSVMYLFEPKSDFVKKTPRYIYQAAEVSRRVLRSHAEAPISIPAISSYFGELYSLQDPQQFDYKRILDCFEDPNGKFQFETAARQFQFIEDITETVIIPFNEEARYYIEELKNTEYPSYTLRKLQPYTVSIFQNEFDKLNMKGVILRIADRYNVLDPKYFEQYYDPYRGLLVPESAEGEGLFC